MICNLLRGIALFVGSVFFVLTLLARQTPIPGGTPESSEIAPRSDGVESVNLDIHLTDPNGLPLRYITVVTLYSTNGELYRQASTNAGYLRFIALRPAEYTVRIVAAAYETFAKRVDLRLAPVTPQIIELHPAPGNDPDSKRRVPPLASKAQKELGNGIEALRSENIRKAKSHLESAYRLAPDHAEVNYVIGVFWSQANDWDQAKSFWLKALDLYPRHFLALLSLGELLLRQSSASEALPLALRAVEVEPSSWRAHALLSNAYLQRELFEEAIAQAEQALALGGEQATAVQTMLAAALAQRGDYQRAQNVLQRYLKEYPADVRANEQLANLEDPARLSSPHTPPLVVSIASSLPLPSNWLPPDIDEQVPPVEPNMACQVSEIVQRSGERIEELVRNVDRYTATELLFHESVNKWGGVAYTEDRKFDYVASIEEIRPGVLHVDEYRRSHRAENEYPGGVQTTGLALLALIFHPHLAENFEMTCEGLARWNGGLAWQVHFRQRPDKPNTIQSYRIGWNGPSYPVGLRGRAWISADTYQIQRLETDLVAPAPQIRLVADHTIIEYGAVHFRDRDVDMWLPQSADLYYDWRGHRAHRHHTFSNFLLFSVEDKQTISAPKPKNPSAQTQSR